MNRKVVALLVAVPVLLILGLGGLALLGKYALDQRKARAAREQVRLEEDRARQLERERDEGRAEAQAVFAAPTRPSKEDADEFARVLDSLARAAERGDGPAAARMFDVERMIGEMDQFGAFAALPPNGRASFKDGMRQGMNQKAGEVLLANDQLRWSRTDIRHVRWSADRREVMVIAVHRAEDIDDVPMRMRWWLVRRADGWKIYDVEDMHLGVRGTRIMAALVTPDIIDRVRRDPMSLQAATFAIREAISLISAGDVEGADAALAPARLMPWPATVRALVEVVEGMILLGRGDTDGALKRFDEADRLLPNMPATLLGRATAYIRTGRTGDALAAARAYQKEVGPDALSCVIEGQALESQEKFPQAAEAYRRALDEVPESPDAFCGLRRSLPKADKAELGERLARAKDVRKFYDQVIFEALEANDTAAGDAMLDALLKARPDDARALGDDIRRKVKRGDFDAAAEALNRALKGKVQQDRAAVLNAYAFAMLDAGKLLEGYAAVPGADADAVFRSLAGSLDDDLFDGDDGLPMRVKQLTELVAAHRKRSPTDPWLWYYEGAILQHAKEYDKAEKAFATGAAKLPPRKADPGAPPGARDWGADSFRYRRVECLFKLKKGLEAYRDVGPAKDTFRQLAFLYDGEDDLDGLAALIAAHRAGGERDPERAYWSAHLFFRKGDYEHAVPVYHKYLADTDADSPNRWAAHQELIRSLLRTRPAEAKAALAEIGPDKVTHPLRAAVAAAQGDLAELERLLEESARNGGKTWFYSDEDFRTFIRQERYRDLRKKYPDPNPPPKVESRGAPRADVPA
jgi:tetratricopeptide (TPR) repeat protein